MSQSFQIPTPKPFPIQVQGQGGGNFDRKTGIGGSLDVNGRAWTSDNGRHSVDVNAGASKYGIGTRNPSPTDYRAGASYRYRF